MEIVFLGTSSGTPTASRNVSAVAVKKANSKSWCLVDCGEGTQYRLLQSSLSLSRLQGIFITHVHGDHCFGLPGLLSSASMGGRTDSLTLVGPAGIRTFIDAAIASSQMHLSYEIGFIDIKDFADGYCAGDFNVEAVELSHRVPSYAYGFSEADRQRKLDIERLKREGIAPGPLWGQIQKGEDITLEDGRVIRGRDYLLMGNNPRKIIVAGDNDNPGLLAGSARSAHVLVHEATYTEDAAEKIGDTHQHSTAKRVAEFAEDAGLPNLVLTHFSPRYRDVDDDGPSLKDIESEARSAYSGHLFLANDLDTFRLGQDGILVKS